MNGIILIDKPKGVTSFHVTSCIKKKLAQKRVGHAGTLDPMATGVLPIMAGQAARLIDLIPNNNKRYIAECKLGIITDTLDSDGKILEIREIPEIIDLNSVLDKFRGEILQMPPMYSAISRDGVRLYELARKGISVDRKLRNVFISQLKLLSSCNDGFIIDVTCSKGTYIRSLIDDIGKEIGCGAIMTDLRRMSSNGFFIEECISLDEFMNSDNYEKFIKDPDKAVTDYPQITVTDKQQIRFLNGGELDLDRIGVNQKSSLFYRVYGTKFLGIGKIENESLKPKCILNS